MLKIIHWQMCDPSIFCTIAHSPTKQGQLTRRAGWSTGGSKDGHRGLGGRRGYQEGPARWTFGARKVWSYQAQVGAFGVDSYLDRDKYGFWWNLIDSSSPERIRIMSCWNILTTQWLCLRGIEWWLRRFCCVQVMSRCYCLRMFPWNLTLGFSFNNKKGYCYLLHRKSL